MAKQTFYRHMSELMKIFYILFAVFICVVAGCTSNEQALLPYGIDVKLALEKMKQDKKFTENVALGYPGAPSELSRLKAQQVIDDALTQLILKSESAITEKQFWLILEQAAKQLGQMDSEEMEQGLSYMEDIMDIYQIQSSDGRLSKWRYGFDPEASSQ